MPTPLPPVDLIASMRRLDGGQLPTRAEERLRELGSGPRKLFTSDLSVNELLVAREVGLTPLAQVMGSSIFHIGLVTDYKGQTGEIVSISKAHREARRLALHRLELEATLLGADLVMGVRLGERELTEARRGKGGDDGDQVIEFTAFGTAARAPWPRRPGAGPVLTDLSGQDLWALARDGWAPCGVVFDFCRYHVFHVMRGQELNPWGGEIVGATHGVEAARDLVARRVIDQATRSGAELVVGSDIQVVAHEVACGWPGCALHDFEVDVSWFGTGIRRLPDAPATRDQNAIPPLVVGMMPLSRRSAEEADETEVAEGDEWE
jgi:uncharacterized protein YbjQ (UPF0145 family)